MNANRTPWRWLAAALGLFGVIYISWTEYVMNLPIKITFQDFYLHLMNERIPVTRTLMLFLPLAAGNQHRDDIWQRQLAWRFKRRRNLFGIYQGIIILESIGYMLLILANILLVGKIMGASFQNSWNGFKSFSAQEGTSPNEACLVVTGLFFARFLLFAEISEAINLFFPRHRLGTLTALALSAVIDSNYYHLFSSLPAGWSWMYHSMLSFSIDGNGTALQIRPDILFSFAFFGIWILALIGLNWARFKRMDL